ncbi:MAG TPA: type II 3-dehydroquinate dehydratase [Candidatus Dormibacteraeota bacterium]|nr:type II 3-dehydroquinate dehydratase [Candidatus Dormibacteraeota bacterium]
MKSVLVVNGPNLNLLGTREPGIYGSETLADLERRLGRRAAELGCTIELRQSNVEGEIVGWLQDAPTRFHAVILNPGAFAHYSYAIRDAITAASVRVVEVHISNIYAREEFRRRSVIAPVAAGLISGLGMLGYELALEAAVRLPA